MELLCILCLFIGWFIHSTNIFWAPYLCWGLCWAPWGLRWTVCFWLWKCLWWNENYLVSHADSVSGTVLPALHGFPLDLNHSLPRYGLLLQLYRWENSDSEVVSRHSWRASEGWLHSYKKREYTWCRGLPWWLSGKGSACNAGDLCLIPGLGRSPWRRAWQPTPVFLPGEFHGQRGLAGYKPWGHTTKQQQQQDTWCNKNKSIS